MTLSRRLKGRRRSPPDAGETQPGAGRGASTSPAASTSPECRYSRDRLESRSHLLPCQEEVLEDERRSLGHLGRKSFFNWRRSTARSFMSGPGSVSRHIGIPAKRGSLTSRWKGSSPRWPLPICSWRSTCEFNGFIESLI